MILQFRLSLKNNLFLVWLSFEGRGETHQFVAWDQNFLWYWRREVRRSSFHSIWKAKAYPNIFHGIFKRILTSAHKSNYRLPWGRWAGGYIYQCVDSSCIFLRFRTPNSSISRSISFNDESTSQSVTISWWAPNKIHLKKEN